MTHRFSGSSRCLGSMRWSSAASNPGNLVKINFRKVRTPSTSNRPPRRFFTFSKIEKIKKVESFGLYWNHLDADWPLLTWSAFVTFFFSLWGPRYCYFLAHELKIRVVGYRLFFQKLCVKDPWCCNNFKVKRLNNFVLIRIRYFSKQCNQYRLLSLVCQKMSSSILTFLFFRFWSFSFRLLNQMKRLTKLGTVSI